MKKGLRLSLGLWLLAILVGFGIAAYVSISLNKALGLDEAQSGSTEEIPLEAIDTPMLQAMQTLLGPDAKYGEVFPPSLRCNLPTPVLTGSNENTALAMLPTGSGGVGAEQLKKCGEPQDHSVLVTIETEKWNCFTVGDAIECVTPNRDANSAEENLVKVLTDNGCSNINPTPEDIKRNPTNPDFTQWAPLQQVSAELPETETDPSKITFTEKKIFNGVFGLPEGIEGPPLPSVPSEPEEPEVPGQRPAFIEVAVPTKDILGPGCGWAFNMTTPPLQDEAIIEALAQSAVAKGEEKHLEAAEQWEKDVASYKKAVTAYNKEIKAWNDWVFEAEKIQAQWDEQLTILAEWETRYGEAYRQAIADREEAIKLKEEATQIWEQLVTQCEADAKAENRPWEQCREMNHLEHMDDEIPDIQVDIEPPKLWPNDY